MTDDTKDTFEQDLSDLSKKEIVAFKEFEKTYVVLYPPPTVPDTAAVMRKDWKFVTSVITALSGTALAGFRTYGAFHAAAIATLNPWLANTEAIVAVLAIEGCTVLFSVRHAYQKRLDDDNVTLALWTAIGISVLAGLDQSLNILEGIESVSFVVRWFLVVAMGLGAPIIGLLSGHTLGAQLVRFENDQILAKEEYERSYKGYRANMLKNWRTSYELNAVNERKVRSLRTVRERSSERTNEPVRPNERSQRTNDGAARNDIFMRLDAIWEAERRVGGVSEIARKIALERSEATGDDPVTDDAFHKYKGSVSESRKAWMADRGLPPEEEQGE